MSKIVWTVLVFLLAPGGAGAQSASALSVTVVDQIGMSLPGASVSLACSGVPPITVVTSASGLAVFHAAATSRCVVTATLSGFKSPRRRIVSLVSEGQSLSLTMRLAPQASGDAVIACPPNPVNTVDSSSSFTVGSEVLRRLPLRRDLSAAASLALGVQPVH